MNNLSQSVHEIKPQLMKNLKSSMKIVARLISYIFLNLHITNVWQDFHVEKIFLPNAVFLQRKYLAILRKHISHQRKCHYRLLKQGCDFFRQLVFHHQTGRFVNHLTIFEEQ